MQVLYYYNSIKCEIEAPLTLDYPTVYICSLRYILFNFFQNKDSTDTRLYPFENTNIWRYKSIRFLSFGNPTQL